MTGTGLASVTPAPRGGFISSPTLLWVHFMFCQIECEKFIHVHAPTYSIYTLKHTNKGLRQGSESLTLKVLLKPLELKTVVGRLMY